MSHEIPFVDKMHLYIDDRGSVYCARDNMNSDWIIDDLKVQRTYVVHNWEKGRIRAWHGHNKAWTGMHVIHGAAKLVARPIDEEKEIAVISTTLSDKNPGMFWIPPGYFNGSMSLVDNTKILVYSTLTFDEVKNDDVRAALTHNDVMQYFKVLDR